MSTTALQTVSPDDRTSRLAALVDVLMEKMREAVALRPDRVDVAASQLAFAGLPSEADVDLGAQLKALAGQEAPNDEQLQLYVLRLLRESPAARDSFHALVHALARGEDVIIGSSTAEVTPNQAAELLGVSRTLVTKMVDAGDLPCRTLPGSSHRRIPLRAVEALLAEQARQRGEMDRVIDTLVDGGLDYY